ncbi:hypothetical protein SERLADRAFT_435521 [Serpula lacrymans var. lacrymans S7.9]|uniref:ER membrane protein complex subunit 2 n=1 Tax=Serpula lacrymans var. lacrymans (strain S7.9) TaxID=578457 RepID=F8NPX9_SERL9|nr:uncharacterized protein SERLADRAFT_435521 [Serpula lacrymans var. lacrymans S7.9]EGO27767.1 hypothetical protein SERLADRAFT_435521 [Serpula lacrymans var. lacrymans S7.9]
MTLDHQLFLFTSLGDKKPSTTRKVHIRRLYDILQLSLQRKDLPRAKRAWAILSRCKEVEWKSMWSTSLYLLSDHVDKIESSPPKIDFLRTMMLQYPDERESILKELVLHLILSNRYREALDELELYLPSFPYHDNPVLHVYAGLLSLQLAQSSGEAQADDSHALYSGTLDHAQTYLERARLLDPNNVVANAFLEKARVAHLTVDVW